GDPGPWAGRVARALTSCVTLLPLRERGECVGPASAGAANLSHGLPPILPAVGLRGSRSRPGRGVRVPRPQLLLDVASVPGGLLSSPAPAPCCGAAARTPPH